MKVASNSFILLALSSNTCGCYLKAGIHFIMTPYYNRLSCKTKRVYSVGSLVKEKMETE